MKAETKKLATNPERLVTIATCASSARIKFVFVFGMFIKRINAMQGSLVLRTFILHDNYALSLSLWMIYFSWQS